MKKDARLFNCLCCNKQVLICSDCDRGNIYCGEVCAKLARTQSHARSNQIYQETSRGKQKHAARQSRYRQRQINNQNNNIVTDDSSHKPPPDVLLSSVPNEPIQIFKKANHCHFCGRSCFPHVRIGFLKKNLRDRIRDWFALAQDH